MNRCLKKVAEFVAVFTVDRTIWAYKPTYDWGGHHPVGNC